MIAIVGTRYRNYTYYTLYRSCLSIYRIAVVRAPSFLFLDDFDGNANISVAIKSGSTVSWSENGDCHQWYIVLSNVLMPLLVVERQQKANVKLSETLRNTFLIPENALPPLLLYENGSTVFTNVDTEPDEQELITKLRGGGASAETPA